MILSSDNYPYLPLKFSVANVEREALAYIDTGAESHGIFAPKELLGDIGAPSALENIELPDGRLLLIEIYFCSVRLGSRVFDTTLATIDGGDELILGRDIIDRFKICLDATKSRVDVYE